MDQSVTSGSLQTQLSATPPVTLRQRSEAYRTLWYLGHDPVAITGLVLITLIVLAAVFAPVVAPYSPTASHINAVLQGPSSTYLLGTDELGRDLLSRIIYGARISLQVSLGSVLIAIPFGVAFGLIAGYFGGWLDSLISRLIDIAFAFPILLLALLLVAVLGNELNNLIIALAIVYIPRFTRITRGSVLSAKADLYVEAARSLGCGSLRIMLRHILPNIVSPIIVQATVNLATAVISEASLSFLGLGVQPPTPAWGSMLNAGKHYMEQNPHLATFPGLAIAVTVLGFNFLGDGLRDALDPRLIK